MSQQMSPIHEIKVKPKAGKNTRLHSSHGTVNERLDLRRSDPRVFRTRGNRLRVNAQVWGDSSLEGGLIAGLDGRTFYRVINDDDFNGDAAGMYVKSKDIEVIRTGYLYTVESGDTLTLIAKKFELTKPNAVKKIFKLNQDVIGDNPDLIKPGQVLFIRT